MTTETPEPTNRMGAATRERVREQLAGDADETNPAFLFSTTHTALLLAIGADLIDATGLARAELAGRGLDANGAWCGFTKAREIHLGDQCADATTDDATAEQTVAEIARRILHIDTLDTRNSDALDFSECAVWAIREALLQAHAAGVAAAARAAGER